MSEKLTLRCVRRCKPDGADFKLLRFCNVMQNDACVNKVAAKLRINCAVNRNDLLGRVEHG